MRAGSLIAGAARYSHPRPTGNARCDGEMAVRAALRASDADREQVAERLRRAAGEGRLRTDELERRLERAFSARTYGELDRVLRDLPGRRTAAVGVSPARALAGSALGVTLALVLALAVTIAVLFVLTGVFAGWLLWIVAGWFLLGRRRRSLPPPGAASGARRLHWCGGWQGSRSRRYWA